LLYVFNTDEDYHFYLDKLQNSARKHQYDIHAYVLMTNSCAFADYYSYRGWHFQHLLYLVLSHSTDKRQAAYRDLYERHFDEKTLEEVSASINKAWVLGE